MTTEKKPRKPRAKKEQINKTKLTLDTILDENKKYDELVVVNLEGVGYTEIYRYFSPQKIEAMFEHFSKFITEYQETIEVINEKEVLNFLNIFILVHFSTLVEKLPETLEEKVDIFGKILNSEIAEKVAESFDKKEIAKITERMMKKFEAVQEMIKTNVETRGQLIDYVKNSKLENKDIILSTMFSDGVEENGE